MKTKEILRADVFVIPNGSFTVKNGGLFEDTRSDLYRAYTANYSNLKDVSTNFEDLTWVELWFCSRNDNPNSNWVDHGIDELRDQDWRVSCRYLPKVIFEGHKEGDCLTINLPINRPTEDGTEISTVKVELCLKQSSYRYSRFGNFEEVLAKV